MRDDQQGCLAGLLQLFLLNSLFDWLQENFGFGKGCSYSGCGCGVIMFIVFILLACQILTGTDWLRLW